MSGVMEGVRVLEVAAWTFVPAAGAVLAEWGADVLKIEHPVSGDPQRALITSGMVPSGPGGVNHMIELPNRGKRSVGLDIAHPDGHAMLMELAKTSDVFLTSFLPQTRRKLKIELDDLRAANENIIYARGSGQGQRGPEAERGGYDGASFWARSVAGVATPPDAEMMTGQPGPAFGDLLGGLTIAGGISAALFHRQKTGEATEVEISLYALGLWATSASVMAADLFGMQSMPAHDRTQGPNPIVGTYRTSDGRFLSLIMLQADRFWGDLVRVLGHPELEHDPRFIDAGARREHAPECVAALDRIFGSRTFEEWRAVLAKQEGVWAPVLLPGEVLDDEQAVANGYIRPVESSAGTTFRMVPSPIQFDETPPDLTRAPDHGEHTDEVLLELGLDMDAILDLKIKGAVL